LTVTIDNLIFIRFQPRDGNRHDRRAYVQSRPPDGPLEDNVMRKLPPLNAVRAFEAAARHQSFTIAAAELCVTVTAISHHIRHLEEIIGLKLFDRKGRKTTLSPTGARLFPMLRNGLDTLASAFAEHNERSAGETLTVTTTCAFAEHWLIPRLPAFTSLCPEVVVNIDASENVVDLTSEGIDLAIRYRRVDVGMGRDDILLEDSHVAVAGPSLCRQGGAPSIEDFAGRPLLGYRWKNAALDGPTWQTWLRAYGHRHERKYRVSWFSEEHLAISAGARGFGPILCGSVVAADQLRAGALRRLDGPALGGFGFSLLLAPGSARKRNVRLFSEWVRNEAAAHIAAN
jgi:LysR family glycine cleavage system transcriptional activator